ncbi:AraC family transcriptional regulator [Gymnodinialimonas mytili]|uniref:AraC family transcriptional regulator n=1 Tax=Gymnodinialimonas mytili TaxID=3126503 RepID=UPI0030EB3D56
MFKIDTYIPDSDAFHFARIEVSDTPPLLEHSHDFYELFLVEQGQVHHWINGLEELLEPGQLTFIRPLDRHAMQAAPGITARILNVMFRQSTADHLVSRYHADMAGKFFWSPAEFPASIRLAGPQKERAVNAMLSLQSSHRGLARIEHFLMSIMTHVLDASASAQDRAPAWLIQAAQAAQDPRVFRRGAEGLITAAGRSQAHVCRETRRHLGLSPTQYVNRIRIQHAAMLLSGTARPVATIAEDCGIENLSYFHRLFRDQYGTTPRRYRARHAKTEPIV